LPKDFGEAIREALSQECEVYHPPNGTTIYHEDKWFEQLDDDE
jgi:hypothetical protein